MENEQYQAESLRIERISEPTGILTTPEKSYKRLQEHLEDEITDYDTWCRHTD